MEEEKNIKTSWELSIPWFNTIASLMVLIVIGWFLVDNIEWFKATIFDKNISERNTGPYRIYAYQMHLSMIKRSIGLFSGFAIMFLGMSVIFYIINETKAEIKNLTFAASFATVSPGIIAILLGVFLIVSTIESKDIFPEYNQSEVPQQGTFSITPPKNPYAP